MHERSLTGALVAALLFAPALARAQAAPVAWDADSFSSLKARLADVSAPAAPSAVDSKTRVLFSRVLIIGASVSSGFRAESPARKAADRFGGAGAVVSIASPGATGAEQVSKLTDAQLSAATVVIGVDLFYWDTVRDCGAGLAAIDELFARAAKRDVPLVLATVPAMHVSFLGGNDNECHARINDKVRQACARDSACSLLDLDGLYAKAAADGGVDLDGKRVAFRDLLVDGLHPSDAGSELIARAIVAAVEKTPAAN